MRCVVSFISVAAFLTHMWLGCCAHHRHACDHFDSTANRTNVCRHHPIDAGRFHDGHHHGGHDDHSPGEPSNGEAPGAPDHCDGNPCVFVVSGTAKAPTSSLVAALPRGTSDQIAGLISPATAHALDSGGSIAPPVRLHLYHQVLLT